MPTNSEAIRLAEASDWRGLQRLIEMEPEYAQEMGDYGMLPIHWACTESHVPVALLNQLLAAYPDGAKIKNDAELLPLHIAIRARVEAAWLDKLIQVYPAAVHVNAPDGVSVLELADHVGLHADAIKTLHRACEVYERNPECDEDADTENGDHPELDGEWEPRKRSSLLVKVSPFGEKLPPTFGRGSNSNSNTPVSPAESLRSSSTEDDPGINDHLMRSNVSSPPSRPLASPSNSSTSNGSANTAPIPRPLHKQMAGPFQRKHSLDYHAHAAAAAAAARQQELLLRSHQPTLLPQRSVRGGRHQSLPVIPSFEHIRFHMPQPNDHHMDESSEEDRDSNNALFRSSSRSSFSRRMRATFPSDGHSFESPPEWKRDDECSICRASFGMFKHRHHCRNCGKSICSQHSADKKIAMESKGFTTPQRVCVTCYAMITHKQARESTRQLSPLQNVAQISGPATAFHQQMQQQQHHRPGHSVAPSTTTNGVSSPGSTGQTSARSSGTHTVGTTSKEMLAEQWLMQTQVNDLRLVVASQQQQIEQLTQSNMHLQQQLLEQEELKAETMLLITQLMTRVSVLEMHKHSSEPEDDDSLQGDNDV